MSKPKTILFDGVCNLCNGSVQFVIKRDKQKKFRFAALQSNFGKNILAKKGLSDKALDSVLLIENGQIYTKSTAALRIARHLQGAWALLYIFILVPPFLRNKIYDWVAKNRYRWFGKEESCLMPSPELKSLFLD